MPSPWSNNLAYIGPPEVCCAAMRERGPTAPSGWSAWIRLLGSGKLLRQHRRPASGKLRLPQRRAAPQVRSCNCYNKES